MERRMNCLHSLFVSLAVCFLIILGGAERCIAFRPLPHWRTWQTGRNPFISCLSWFAAPRATPISSAEDAHTCCLANSYGSLIDNARQEEGVEYIRHYTNLAMEKRGEPEGLQALTVLARKCKQRTPFQFDDEEESESDQASLPQLLTKRRPGSVVTSIRQLLPTNITTAFLEEVQKLENMGCFSTNPDSVDGLPSLHLNLVSHGQPLFPSTGSNGDTETESAEDLKDDLEAKEQKSFEAGIQRLLQLVEEPIYKVLLPKVRDCLQDDSIEVSDVFLRRYGENLGQKSDDFQSDDDDSQLSRTGISAHYDVFSRVTSVIALDNVAANGQNGLYTTHLSSTSSIDSSSSKEGPQLATSNHSSLRRFFPLHRGDGVVHTWDVLHGVDVQSGLERTSLIVWFTQKNSLGAKISPWLLADTDALQDDDVTQFVLASALSSLGESGFSQDVTELSTSKAYPSEHELYLQSAQKGNTFALTRVGSLLEEGALSQELIEKADQLLCDLITNEESQSALSRSLQTSQLASECPNERSMWMAIRFWFEGAIRGNPLAQRALADELMLRASQDGNSDTRLLAAVLFGLAAQQGSEEALDALQRVVEFDLACRGVQDEDAFRASPVVQTARAAMSS